MTKKLVVLCFPVSEMGHINASLGIATALAKRGHRVVFAAEKSWQGRFLKDGFEEEIYEERDTSAESIGKQWSEMISQVSEMLKKSPLEKVSLMPVWFKYFAATAPYFRDRLAEIIVKVNPDVIVEDHAMITPELMIGKAPVVKLFSAAPLMLLNDDRLPPSGLGLPLNDPKSWEQGRVVLSEATKTMVDMINNFLRSEDPNLPKVGAHGIPRSNNLTIYIYPKAAVEDYLKIVDPDDSLLRIDHCLRKSDGNFELPEKFKTLPGKIIYLSMGSAGSSVVEMMKRLIDILAKSTNKFIVVKGHNHKKYELPENMYGQEYVPQMDVLPLVDLVISHGGNNSFVETLYFGKPMIVLPMLADQFDNAQRVEELRIGRKFDPFTVTEGDLLNAIESLLFDSKAKEKLENISKEMRESNEMEKALDRIEYVAEHPKYPNYV